MPKPPHIISSVPPWPEGLQGVRGWRPAARCAWPTRPSSRASWPIDLIRDGTIPRCEVPPANSLTSPSRVDPLGSAGYEQLRRAAVAGARGARHGRQRGHDVPIAEWCVTMMVMFERDFAACSITSGRTSGIATPAPVGAPWPAGRHHRLRQHRSRGGGGVPLPGAGVGHGSRDRPAARPLHTPGTGDPDGVMPHRTFVPDQMADFLPHSTT